MQMESIEPGPNLTTLDVFTEKMRTNGWYLFEDVVEPNLLARMVEDLDFATSECRMIQHRNGLPATEGTSHHLLTFERSFMAFLEKMYFDEHIKAFFKSNYVLNSFGGVITEQGIGSYVMNTHRDVRFFTGECKLLLNMIVLLDDFTLENGATHLLSGSHLRPEKVSHAQVLERSDRLVAKAGSIGFFDSNLWHSAGENKTNRKRRALTINWSKPLVKPQFDYLTFLGSERVSKMPEEMRQILGWNSRIPRSLEEWYQPPENRMYKPGQD